jgi:hypothetical protein
MKWLTVKRLKLEDIASALPLIQLHHKDLGLAEWTDYARGVLIDSNDATTQGFLVVYDGQGTIHGILQYEMRRDLVGQSRMVATNIMVCGLFHRHCVRVTRALIQSLSDMARDLSCEQVAIEIPANEYLLSLGSEAS